MSTIPASPRQVGYDEPDKGQYPEELHSEPPSNIPIDSHPAVSSLYVVWTSPSSIRHSCSIATSPPSPGLTSACRWSSSAAYRSNTSGWSCMASLITDRLAVLPDVLAAEGGASDDTTDRHGLQVGY